MAAPRAHAWSAARSDLDALGAVQEPHATAAAYVARWPKHAPDFFTDRSRDLARRAFDNGDGWACRLLSALETPAHFSLHHQHLELPRDAAEPCLMFDRGNVRRWKAAILSAFRGPCRWRLELGNGGRIHAHVLAALEDGPPELPRSGEIVKPCEAYFETVVRYQLKPPLEYSPEHLAIWLEAKKRGKLPTLSGTHGIPNRRTWGIPSSSGITLVSTLPESTPEQPQTATAAILPTPAPEPQPSPRSERLRRHRSHPRRVPFSTFSNPLEKTPRRDFEPCTRRFSPSCRHRIPRERGPPSTRPARNPSTSSEWRPT